MTTYLQITLQVADKNRQAAAGVYTKYKGPFLDTVAGAESKSLLVRDEDVPVPLCFNFYLHNAMFIRDCPSKL